MTDHPVAPRDTNFITFGEAIELFGFNEAARIMRQAMKIGKPLAPWPSKSKKRKGADD